jgi:DNA-binding beta-propeller fold protein YncE
LASDGTLLGTFPVGDGPFELAFDGIHIFVSLFNTDRVGELRASDGTRKQSIRGSDGPQGLVFDGTNLWVANYYSNTVSKISKSQP